MEIGGAEEDQTLFLEKVCGLSWCLSELTKEKTPCGCRMSEVLDRR